MQRNAIEQRAELHSRKIGTRQVDLVIVAVEAAVTDQHQHEGVIRLGVARDLRQRVLQIGLGGLWAVERGDLRIRAGGVQQFVDFLRLRSEALLVVGFAAQARDRDVERRGVQSAWGQQTNNSKPRTNSGSLHTTPHLLRSTHSVQHSNKARKKTIGMSQRSLVSRTVMPASE